MASTYSDSYKLELQETGANANTWGNNTNTNLQTIDKFTAGYLSKSVAGSANVTLTTANADPTAESSNKVIELTGTLTGNIYVFIPAVENYYIFYNNTAGAFTVDIAPTGHAANSVQVTQGAHTIMYCKNGDTMVDLFANSLGNLSIKNTLTVNNSVFYAANGTVNATSFSGNGSSLTGVSSIPSGTTALFFQGAAPTGWTQNTDASINTTTLRVVTGTGGGTGGADAFSSVFTGSKSTDSGAISFTDLGSASVPSSLSVGSYTLSTPEIPSHNHTANDISPFGTAAGYPPATHYNPPAPDTASAGGGGGHSHPISGSLSLSGSASATTPLSVPAMNLKFANVVAATKD
jgi:hypothetical protein